MANDRRLTAGILAVLFAGSAPASGDVSSTERLAIGATGITCVTEPCPWRGIVQIDDERRDPLRPYWAGKALPRVDAKDDDAARLKAAWDAMECLEVEGEVMNDPDENGALLIRVERIVGACP